IWSLLRRATATRSLRTDSEPRPRDVRSWLMRETKRASSVAFAADAAPAEIVIIPATSVESITPDTKRLPMFGPLLQDPNNQPASPRHLNVPWIDGPCVPSSPSATRLTPAEGPVALRPRLAAGLALSWKQACSSGSHLSCNLQWFYRRSGR